jgi:hypothetical protein
LLKLPLLASILARQGAETIQCYLHTIYRANPVTPTYSTYQIRQHGIFKKHKKMRLELPPSAFCHPKVVGYSVGTRHTRTPEIMTPLWVSSTARHTNFRSM